MSATFRSERFVCGLIVFVLASTASGGAHEKKSVGPFTLTIGWGDEPAFSGFKNAAEVDVADAAGAPVGEGSLSVEVLFGEERMPLPLRPAFGRPGKFRAWLVPTRPGIYAFHITG